MSKNVPSIWRLCENPNVQFVMSIWTVQAIWWFIWRLVKKWVMKSSIINCTPTKFFDFNLMFLPHFLIKKWIDKLGAVIFEVIEASEREVNGSKIENLGMQFLFSNKFLSLFIMFVTSILAVQLICWFIWRLVTEWFMKSSIILIRL